MPKVVLDSRISQAVDKANAAASSFDLSGAADAGFIKAESAVDPATGVALATNDIIFYTVSADSLSETGYGVVDKTAHTVTRNVLSTVNAGTRGTSKLDFSGASATPKLKVDFTALAAMSALNNARREPNVRITLTANVPVTTSDVTGATSIYAEPYQGNAIPLYLDAAGTIPYTAKLPANTVSKALGTLASATIPVDVFLDFGVTSANVFSLTLVPWTSTTARATAVDKVEGLAYKNGDYRFLHVATFTPTATTTTEDSVLKRLLWNRYNQVERNLIVKDTTAHTYTTGTARQYRAQTSNQVQFTCGEVRGVFQATLHAYLNATGRGLVWMSLNDPTFAALGNADPGQIDLTTSGDERVGAGAVYLPALGVNTLAMCQFGLASSSSYQGASVSALIKC